MGVVASRFRHLTTFVLCAAQHTPIGAGSVAILLGRPKACDMPDATV
jgi:hypothetical protein